MKHRFTCITTNKPPCWKAWQPSLQLRFFRCPCMSLRLGRSWSVFAQVRWCASPGAHYERPLPPSWKFCIRNASQWKCAFAHGQASKLARYGYSFERITPVTEKKRKKKKKKRGGEMGNAFLKKPTIPQNASKYFTVWFICKSTRVNICKIYFALFKACSTFFSLHPHPKFLFLLWSQLFETFSKNSRRDACYVLSIKLETSKSRAPKH